MDECGRVDCSRSDELTGAGAGALAFRSARDHGGEAQRFNQDGVSTAPRFEAGQVGSHGHHASSTTRIKEDNDVIGLARMVLVL